MGRNQYVKPLASCFSVHVSVSLAVVSVGLDPGVALSSLHSIGKPGRAPRHGHIHVHASE